MTYNRSLQEENQEEYTYNVTDTLSHASTKVHPENEEVQISFPNSEDNPFLDTLRVDHPPKNHPKARSLLADQEDHDASPKMRWDSVEQNLVRSPVLQSGSQSHDFDSSEAANHYEMEGGCDAPGRKDSTQRSLPPGRYPNPRKKTKENTGGGQTPNLEKSEASIHRKDGDCDNHSLVPSKPPNPKKQGNANTEHNDMCCIKLPEIEEDDEIHLKRLEIHDKVLGEGEYGIVYKGSYRRNDEKVIDVAVKQLKGMYLDSEFIP